MVILRMASMPSSGKATMSFERMFCSARMAAGPPIEPRKNPPYFLQASVTSWLRLPFATMIIVAALAGISESVVESAQDVGAGKVLIFFKIILPLSYKDVLIAATFVFMSNISSFTTPYLIGANFPQMLGVYLRKQFGNAKYEIAAATSVVIFVLCSISAIVYLYTNMKEQAWEEN